MYGFLYFLVCWTIASFLAGLLVGRFIGFGMGSRTTPPQFPNQYVAQGPAR